MESARDQNAADDNRSHPFGKFERERSGQGTTRIRIELLLEGTSVRRDGAFFTLEYIRPKITRLIAQIGFTPASAIPQLPIDTSDEISAEYVARDMANAARGHHND